MSRNITPPLFFCLVLILALTTGACRKKSPQRHSGGSPPQEKPRPATGGPEIKINDISFAGPAGHRPEADFARGEAVVCLFTVSNFTYSERKAHITADVQVRGAGDKLILTLEDQELLKGDAPTLTPGTLRTAATLPLPAAAPAGSYTVILKVKDLLGGRVGVGKGSFTVLGTPPTAADSLTLDAPHLVADVDVPAGSVVPVAFEVRGFKTQAAKGLHQIKLTVAASLVDASGKVVLQRPQEKLAGLTLPFKPLALPLEYQLPLPRGLSNGTYRLQLDVKDEVGGTNAAAKLKLAVVPEVLSVVNLHVHDNSGLDRPSFLLGEQIFIRLSVFGLKEIKGEYKAAVDLAVASPHGDIYLAKKDAGKIEGEASKAAVRAGRFPAQIPLTLPTLAPTGKYRVVIRARDLLAGKEVTREKAIRLMGTAPKPMGSFKVDQLEVRLRPDLPPIKGDTFGAGRTYHLALRVGGVKLKEDPKRIYSAALEGSLRLRDLEGKVVHERKEIFKLRRRMTYRPLRLVLPAEWDLPSDLPSGLYDLEVSLLNTLDDMVSQLTRRVEIVGQPPAVEVRLP